MTRIPEIEASYNYMRKYFLSFLLLIQSVVLAQNTKPIMLPNGWKLTPAGKSMTGMIEKIEITLSPKSETVKSIRIFEGSDNVTQINFNNVKLNAVVNPTVFQDVP